MGCDKQLREAGYLVIGLKCLPGLWPQAIQLLFGGRVCPSKEQLAQRSSSPKDRSPEYRLLLLQPPCTFDVSW